VINAAQERAFYDRHYSRYLELPDASLRCSRSTLERDLADPAQPVWERRRLYEAVLRRLLALRLAEMAVLDYGCGTGDWGLVMAGEGAEVTFLDLSPVAVELCLRRAKASGVLGRCRGAARDASDLACFSDARFDLVFANAALHHTLKYPGALDELVRVLKPGGILLAAETLGNNPLLNAARRLGWRITQQAEEQGEDILLGDRELAELRARFTSVRTTPLNFLAMGKRLFRRRFTNRAARLAVGALEIADRALLGAAPFLRRYCGEVIVEARK
jgi:SAM-dependent methyltransferase